MFENKFLLFEDGPLAGKYCHVIGDTFKVYEHDNRRVYDETKSAAIKSILYKRTRLVVDGVEIEVMRLA